MLVSVHLEIVLILTQDTYMVCNEHTTRKKSFWTHPIELLGDVGHGESRFDPFGDNVSTCARYVHCLQRTYYWLRNHFGHTQWYS
jgi:hypothetical protein